MTKALLLLMATLCAFIGCHNKDGQTPITTDTANSSVGIPEAVIQQSDSTDQIIQPDSVIEKKISDIVLALPEIKNLLKDSAALSDTTRHFAFMTNKPGDAQTDYVIQAGYDNQLRFETRYIIHISPQNWSVRFLDVATDSLFTPEDFRRLKK